MSRRVVIDSQAFGRAGGSLQGEIRVSSLTRLHDLLADTDGCLTYRLEGMIGSRRRSQLAVAVDGMLSLRCQRCLEALRYPLDLRSLLEFIDAECDLTQEELEDDSRDFIPSQKELDVAMLIEDEILLALPTVQRHENCVLPEVGRDSTGESPFSILASLRGRA